MYFDLALCLCIGLLAVTLAGLLAFGAEPYTPFARSCSQLLIQFSGSAPGSCFVNLLLLFFLKMTFLLGSLVYPPLPGSRVVLNVVGSRFFLNFSTSAGLCTPAFANSAADLLLFCVSTWRRTSHGLCLVVAFCPGAFGGNSWPQLTPLVQCLLCLPTLRPLVSFLPGSFW